MAKITLLNSVPAVGAAFVSFFWLCILIDAFSMGILKGLGALAFSLPVVGTLLAVLSIDVIFAYELNWEPAYDWWHYFHESVSGALLIAVMTIPWLMGVVSFAAMGVLDLVLGGSGAMHSILNLIAKIPVLGSLMATIIALSVMVVFSSLFLYVCYSGFNAMQRLCRAPRTGYVQNGVPLAEQRDGGEDRHVEDGEFARWESNTA